jgi:thioesterase domain-containing protein
MLQKPLRRIFCVEVVAGKFMSDCPRFEDKLDAIWHVFHRGHFRFVKGLEASNPAQAHRLNSRAQRVNDAIIVGDRTGSREVEPTEKALTKVRAMKPPRKSTDEARELLWTRILGTAKQLGRREWRSTKPLPQVFQLREGAAEAPVYFIASQQFEFHLAQLMCSERSIFGVEMPWPSAWRQAAAKNDIEALPTMDQLVAPYTAALSMHARSSSCVLAGHSFSGLMAFEAAHQLNELGIKVETVILLDAPAKYPAPHQLAWQQLQKDWGKTPLTDRTTRSIVSRLGCSWSIMWWLLKKEMGQLMRGFLRHRGKLTTRLDDLGAPWHLGMLERLYSNAVRTYRLRCLDCGGVLFRADDEGPVRTLDGSLGWGNLFRRGLEIIQVTGNHLTMMQQNPHDQTLAQAMDQLLARRANEDAIRPG